MTNATGRRHVLSVQHYPAYGGPHNAIIHFEPHLNEAGVDTVVAITNEPGSAASRLAAHVRCEQIPLHRLRWTINPATHLRTAVSTRSDIQQLRRLIRDHDVDLVKVHGLHNPQGAIAARLERVPIVWVLSSTRPSAPLRRIGIVYARRLADAVLLNGRGLMRFFPGLSSIHKRVFAYYPPVDPEAFVPLAATRRRQVRASLLVPEDVPLVGTIAAISRVKGIDVFVRAAALVRDAIPEARFVVVGPVSDAQRSYQARLMRAASAAGLLPGALTFIGPTTDVPGILGAMDVKVISSRDEGTTTTAGEAMACGVSVVATDVGAVSEIVADGETGYVVPPKRPDAIADRVIRLLRDPALRNRMGRAGRAAAKERFTPEVGARVHLRAYDYALRRRGRPGLASLAALDGTREA